MSHDPWYRCHQQGSLWRDTCVISDLEGLRCQLKKPPSKTYALEEEGCHAPAELAQKITRIRANAAPAVRNTSLWGGALYPAMESRY